MEAERKRALGRTAITVAALGEAVACYTERS